MWCVQINGSGLYESRVWDMHCVLPGNLYCKPEVTKDYLKRDIEVEINWPATGIGSRRIVHCPHAYDQSMYAHRDCVLSIAVRKPTWNYANVTMCPVPPFSQGVERLAEFLVCDLPSSPVRFFFSVASVCVSVCLLACLSALNLQNY